MPAAGVCERRLILAEPLAGSSEPDRSQGRPPGAERARTRPDQDSIQISGGEGCERKCVMPSVNP